MVDDFQPLVPGDRFRPSAAWYNATLEAIKRRNPLPVGDGDKNRVVRIRNDSGQILDMFAIVGIDEPVLRPPATPPETLDDESKEELDEYAAYLLQRAQDAREAFDEAEADPDFEGTTQNLDDIAEVAEEAADVAQLIADMANGRVPPRAPDLSDEAFKFDKIFASSLPTASGVFAILQEPAPRDGYAEVLVTGETWVLLNVLDPAHVYAQPANDDYQKLQSQSASGPCKILWQESRTYGAWSSTTAYVAGNKVSRLGINYTCKLAHTNQQPPNATYWTPGITLWAWVAFDGTLLTTSAVGESDLVQIQNETGDTLAKFAVVGIGNPITSPSDDETEFLQRVGFLSANPAVSSPFAIMQEGIDADTIGDAMMTGVTQCKVSISSSSHTYAAPGIANYDALVSQSTAGPARILYKDVPTSTQLNGAINNSTTTIVVDAATGWYNASSLGSLVVLVESEKMLVLGVSGTTWTVTRAYASTAAASHADNVAVTFSSGMVWCDVAITQDALGSITSGISTAYGPDYTFEITANATGAPAFSGSGNTVTLNIPLASGNDIGLVSYSTQVFGGTKVILDGSLNISAQEDNNTNPLLAGSNYALRFINTGGNPLSGAIGMIYCAGTSLFINAGYAMEFATDGVLLDATNELAYFAAPSFVVLGTGGGPGGTATTGGLTFTRGIFMSGTLSVALGSAVTGTLPAANGGTGRTSHTAYAVLCGGTTSTAAQQSIASVGTTGQVLTSNGAAALPTFQTLTAGDVTGPAGATADAVAIYNSTTGKVIKNSSLTLTTGIFSTSGAWGEFGLMNGLGTLDTFKMMSSYDDGASHKPTHQILVTPTEIEFYAYSDMYVGVSTHIAPIIKVLDVAGALQTGQTVVDGGVTFSSGWRTGGTYAGSSSVVTVGTVTAGTWSATTIATTKGGTGLTSYTTGDVLYASASNTLSKLAAGTNGYVLTMAAGVPAWAAAAVSFTDELAQDAIGGILVDSSTIDLTYSDATPSITAALILSAVNAWTGQQYFAEATLSDGANISWNLDTKQSATVTLAGNRTLDNPTNMKAGANYTLRVNQDATGSRTLAYGTAYQWAGGSVPTLTATPAAVDILRFYCDGSNMYGQAIQDFAGTPITLFYDTYTGSNGTNATSHTPDTGSASTSTSAQYQIQSNKLTNTVDVPPLLPLVTDVATGNVAITAIVNMANVSGTSGVGGTYSLAYVVYRYQDDNNFCVVQVYAGTLTVYEFAAGTPSTLASTACSMSDGVSYTIKVRASGTSVKVWVDGGLLINTTSSYLQSETQHGVAIVHQTTAASGTTIDNLTITTP